MEEVWREKQEHGDLLYQLNRNSDMKCCDLSSKLTVGYILKFYLSNYEAGRQWQS